MGMIQKKYLLVILLPRNGKPDQTTARIRLRLKRLQIPDKSICLIKPLFEEDIDLTSDELSEIDLLGGEDLPKVKAFKQERLNPKFLLMNEEEQRKCLPIGKQLPADVEKNRQLSAPPIPFVGDSS